MQIGDFARRAGLSVRAIRYYEELRLLQPQSHSNGGFRLYGEENLKRIRVISFLKDLGLSLTDIGTILQAKKTGEGNRQIVRSLTVLLEEKLSLVDDRLAALSRVKSELAHSLDILRRCESCSHAVILDALACRDCESLQPRGSVPATFEVLLQ